MLGGAVFAGPKRFERLRQIDDASVPCGSLGARGRQHDPALADPAVTFGRPELEQPDGAALDLPAPQPLQRLIEVKLAPVDGLRQPRLQPLGCAVGGVMTQPGPKRRNIRAQPALNLDGPFSDEAVDALLFPGDVPVVAALIWRIAGVGERDLFAGERCGDNEADLR